tara:strand:- start:323 stop:424 length:102 start_codon:yes stop_codon:yes gene_type:complete
VDLQEVLIEAVVEELVVIENLQEQLQVVMQRLH